MALDVELIRFTGKQQDLHAGLRRLLNKPPKRGRGLAAFWESNECYLEIIQMSTALNDMAPPGYRFGANDYDPTSLGYWRIL